jgi:poly(A)-specific ribonuclease
LEVLPVIREAINSSAFVAIDTELTGLTVEAPPRDAFLETADDRYKRLRETDFLIIQFGLCCFRQLAVPDSPAAAASASASTSQAPPSFEAKPFNVLIFPKQFGKESEDRRFGCQASCMRFLAGQGFNFNKLFGEGVSYMTPEKAAEEQHKAEARRKANAEKLVAVEKEADRKFLEEATKRVREWLETATETPLSLAPCN